MSDRPLVPRYFPAVVCAEFDSPVDALRSLCVPHDEAMDLVAASWRADGRPGTEEERKGGARKGERRRAGMAIVAVIDGGRSVAALPLADGRWAACHAYPEHAAVTRAEAERRLRRLTRGRKKRGIVGLVDVRHFLSSHGFEGKCP